MTEQKQNEDRAEVEEETMLCPSCLQANPPDARFCSRCDAPLSAGAVLGPFEQTRAQRFIFHRAATGPSSFIVVLGVWVIFLPILIACALFFGSMIVVGPLTLQLVLECLLPLFVTAFSAALLWRVTANFQKQRRTQSANDQA